MLRWIFRRPYRRAMWFWLSVLLLSAGLLTVVSGAGVAGQMRGMSHDVEEQAKTYVFFAPVAEFPEGTSPLSHQAAGKQFFGKESFFLRDWQGTIRHTLCAAYVPDLVPTDPTADETTYTVFTVKCETVEMQNNSALGSYCDIRFTVIDNLDGTGTHEGKTFTQKAFCDRAPMKSGESYILWGRVKPNQKGEDIFYWGDEDNIGFLWPLFARDDQILCDAPEGSFLLMERMEGTIDTFLAAPAAERWEGRIKAREINARSVRVLGCETVDAIYTFATGETVVTEGRAFTAAEAAEGSPVMLVSDTLAEANGWHAGDTVSLSLYDSEYSLLNTPAGFDPVQGFTEEMTLEIVGIYQTTPRADIYRLHEDTVILPQGALTARYTPNRILSAMAGEITPGREEDVLFALADMGDIENIPGITYGDVLRFYPNEAAAHLTDTASASATARWWEIGYGALGLTLLALSLWCLHRGERRTLAALRGVGADRQTRCGGLCGLLALQTLFAAALTLVTERVTRPLWLIPMGFGYPPERVAYWQSHLIDIPWQALLWPTVLYLALGVYVSIRAIRERYNKY